MVAVEVGPWMRWVRVLRAAVQVVGDGRGLQAQPVVRRDHLVLSGLWFHSHCGAEGGAGEGVGADHRL